MELKRFGRALRAGPPGYENQPDEPAGNRRPGRSARRLLAAGVALALGGSVPLISASPALADNVNSSVISGGNDSVALGATTPVRYEVKATGNDGCDAADGTPVTIAVQLPANSGVTASPSTLHFGVCDAAQEIRFGGTKVGQYEINVSASDADASDNYNLTPAKFTLKVLAASDTTGPVLTLPSSPTLEATGPSGASYTYSASAFDAGDNASRPVTCGGIGTYPATATFPLGSSPISCSSTDSKGNTTTGSFVVLVRDTTGPALSLSDKTVEAAGPAGAPVSYTATATDVVDGPVAVTCTPAAGSTFALGSTTVNCTATDTRGNASTGALSVRVQDTTAPSLTLAHQTVEATGPAGATVAYPASASDVVSGAVAVTCDAPSGGTFPIATTTVNCSAQDSAGNHATGSFTITVGDHTAPTLALTDTTAEATGPAGADVAFSASAADIVDGTRPVNCTPGSGSRFALGDTTVSCSASDTRGNSASGNLQVTVKDSTPPALTLTDQTAEATGPGGAPVNYTATALDIVDGALGVTCSAASGSTFALGATVVTCDATDSHNNTGRGAFTVTVRDTTKPELTLAGAVAEATGPGGANVAYTATASDLVDGTVPVTCSLPSGGLFALGATAVTCDAVDRAGNPATGLLTITVADTTAPHLTLSDTTAEATSALGATVEYTATATDTVEGDQPVTCTPPSGSTFALGATDVTCTTRDSHGNHASGMFRITVQDTTAPLLGRLSDINLVATSAAGAVATYAHGATDAVDGAVPATCTPASGSTFAAGASQVACTATDKAGNTSAAGTFVVNVTFAWSNVLQPLNADNSSVYKIGSTVPVKFALTGASAGITTLPAKLYYKKISNSTSGAEMEALSTTGADTGNTFRFDPAAKQYIFNLSTKGFSEGTYQLRIDLGDGVSHTVNMTSRK